MISTIDKGLNGIANFIAKISATLHQDAHVLFSVRKAGTKPLLSWKIFSSKMPWGIVFLLGGGYSMAKASQVYVPYIYFF